ncbi:MAG: hypothetical protein EA381_03095 [Planctomycetaceae bacterium]|nr:MAG: hypothetical protein EA381_03095 [Planctomycetaceae bacterium]
MSKKATNKGQEQHSPRHHETLVRLYKTQLAEALRGCGLYDLIPDAAWKGKFVVDIKPVGNGQAVLKYLTP